ncbi:uncharacterized protein LOC133204573 [Saccostrea echinata]|uniref:uncharacterized protein LOC133204573 n=1 Tax=Saccostrea echinata TaxID=191078 RepID=UPI002A8052CD|nr:uncharacterized protein LOC133204573 [Saccostrea echinata]
MTNAVLWFISEMEEIDGYYENFDIHANRSQDPCFWNSNITREVLSKLNPYLSPANIEFFLLSSGLILSMMPKHSQSDLGEEEEQTPEELVPILGPTERRHLRERPHQLHHPVTHFAFIIIVIIVNLTLITGNVVFVFVLPDSNSMFCTWLVIDTLYKLIMLIVILLIYYHIHIFGETEPRRHHLKPGQYILLISTMGTVAVCAFGMIGGVQILPAFKGHIYITDNSLDITVAFLQTVLLIHMERINRLNSEGNHIPTELLCVFLALCNITYWILDSFIDVRYIESKHITGEIFDKENWDDVQDLLAPMLIFYRFHAFLDWYVIYCKFKRMYK